MHRRKRQIIINDLNKKLVFLVGPRQVGKTWLALDIEKSFDSHQYLNYDRFEDREIIHKEAWLSSTELLILDELHKMPGWKNFIKGVYDTKPPQQKILVTGSARLDIFRQTGDSLAGRFFVHHLLPFDPIELDDIQVSIDYEHLLRRGGFPEPFLSETDTDAERWRSLYADSLIRTDVLDFKRIDDIRAIQLVFNLLRRRVGSPVSYKSISEDVQKAPGTIKKFIQILEALYIIFRVTPYSKNIARSLLKEPKIYFYDTGLVEGNIGSRVENFMAVSLLKQTHIHNDEKGVPSALHYLRTKDGREVDFCFTDRDKIQFIAEVKTDDSQISKSLQYFHEKYFLPAYQLVYRLKRERKENQIEIRNFSSFYKILPSLFQ